jgi:hypothetical protein
LSITASSMVRPLNYLETIYSWHRTCETSSRTQQIFNSAGNFSYTPGNGTLSASGIVPLIDTAVNDVAARGTLTRNSDATSTCSLTVGTIHEDYGGDPSACIVLMSGTGADKDDEQVVYIVASGGSGGTSSGTSRASARLNICSKAASQSRWPG